MSGIKHLRNTLLYEINTLPFLRSLSDSSHKKITLGEIPDSYWRIFQDFGFEFVWLMGIWQRSPAAKREALNSTPLRNEFSSNLPGWTEKDIGGSPYAIFKYEPDPSVGRIEDLQQLRMQLKKKGVKIILDFVPNHVSRDHEWTSSHPEYFVKGTDKALFDHSEWFFTTESGISIAHGRDPYFPSWTDTAQINFNNAEVRKVLTGELLKIAEVADGVRCDMAMLGLNEVFNRTWGQVVNMAAPQNEFWIDAISRVKDRKPEFIFIGEVYWGLEKRLQEIGFDYTYDKTLYDKLRHDSGQDISNYLKGNTESHADCVHFIENHDEPRAVTAFGADRSFAAAAIVATLPGIYLVHEGQMEGRKVHTPVQLARQPEEIIDQDLQQKYYKLFALIKETQNEIDFWSSLPVSPPDVLAWLRRNMQRSVILAVNFSPESRSGTVKVPYSNSVWKEHLSQPDDRILTATGDELFLELHPYQVRFLISL